MPRHQHARHPAGHDHGAHSRALPELLDLDAEVLGAYLPAVTSWASEHVTDVRTVLDLGAGTGVGSVALAGRFPEAEVLALEQSPAMVDRLASASRAAGLTGRLRVVPVDLDEDWPDLGTADLAWASSSLHEVADPARVLRGVHDALRPGGVVVVVEMAELPGLLPDDVGSGRPGLEARCHAALAALGWNAYPDWAPALQAAGLDVVDERRFPVEVGPGEPRAEEYARAALGQQRLALTGALQAEDLATLDRLLADHGPDALLSSTRLTIRGTRVAWLARRPTVPGAAHRHRHDVVVVGGGAAGLSAAVTLARSLRDVLVVDAGEPRNAPADGAHNLLGREGVPPLDLLEVGRQEALGYGAQIRRGRATAVSRTADGFELTLADGDTVAARRLLLVTGLVDELPEVPGVRELWGSDVLHCPYCHGYEVRGRRIGVLGTSPNVMHQTLLLRQLSSDVTLFLHEAPEPDEGGWEQLAALGIRVVTGRVRELAADSGRLTAVVLADGHAFEVDAVAVQPRFVSRGDLYEQLGGTLTEHPMGRHIATDPAGATGLPGVWAAGNAGDLSAMVGASAAQGVMAGAMLNADLVMTDARAAVQARADRSRAVREAAGAA